MLLIDIDEAEQLFAQCHTCFNAAIIHLIGILMQYINEWEEVLREDWDKVKVNAKEEDHWRYSPSL